MSLAKVRDARLVIDALANALQVAVALAAAIHRNGTATNEAAALDVALTRAAVAVRRLQPNRSDSLSER